MRDSVRISVESDHGEETARIHDDDGEVDAGDATFSFELVDGGSISPEPETRASTGNSEQANDSRQAGDFEDTGDSNPRYVCPLTAVPTDSTLRCEATNGRRGTEVILRRGDGEVFAWRNSCPHGPKVQLDPGGGAIVDDDQLVCHEHGARFECGDGFCTYGPCRGDALDEIEVEVRDGDVYLADDRFDACVPLD